MAPLEDINPEAIRNRISYLREQVLNHEQAKMDALLEVAELEHILRSRGG